MPRRFPIVQFPNRPLIAVAVASALARATTGRPSQIARLVAWSALLVWSAEEMVGGANWFRRLLGAGGAAYGLTRLLPTARRALAAE
jgi:hypothetical protein